MSGAKHAHTLIKRMQPAPVPDGASQPGSKAKLYQTGAKGVDQVSSTMRRRCFFRRGAPISKCALLTFPEERRENGGSVRGRVRLHKSQQEYWEKSQAGIFQSSQDPQSSEPNMQPYDTRTSQPRHGSFSKRPATPKANTHTEAETYLQAGNPPVREKPFCLPPLPGSFW